MMISKKVDISLLRANEACALRPRDLTRYIDNPNDVALVFTASLASGDPLPSGIECTQKGILRGTPARNTSQDQPYQITVSIKSNEGDLTLETKLWVYPTVSSDDIKRIQQDAWLAIAQGGELPDSLKSIIDRPVTEEDLFYLLERYATFIIWNADDMRLAETGKSITIADAGDQFAIYDFGVCLVATPTDLYDQNRVLTHAIAAAKSMLREAHNREWNVEFGGFDRMAQAAYYEAHELNAKGGYQMEVRNYQPVAVQKGSEDIPRHEIE